jgi:hypothetical protein
MRKEKAREEAIKWQYEFDGKIMSWSDVVYWADHFRKTGRRYGLLKEFRENGII